VNKRKRRRKGPQLHWRKPYNLSRLLLDTDALRKAASAALKAPGERTPSAPKALF
jgi:hypothetical protein